jgi:hypothetical protein
MPTITSWHPRPSHVEGSEDAARADQEKAARSWVYHLLAKEAAYASNLHHMDGFRKAREVENAIRLFAR